MIRQLLLGAALFAAIPSMAQTNVAKMNSFVNDLMKKMTVDEKIGQLNLLTPGGGIATGSVVNPDVETKIRSGRVGGLFGDWSGKNKKGTGTCR